MHIHIYSSYLKNNMAINISRTINKYVPFDQCCADKPALQKQK